MRTQLKRPLLLLALMLAVLPAADGQAARVRQRTRGQAARQLRVVTTIPDFASLTEVIAGDNVTVEHIVQGVQDPHRIRPKPSFITMVKQADMLIATGLDLEMWLPTVVDKSGNRRVRSGEVGYVAVRSVVSTGSTRSFPVEGGDTRVRQSTLKHHPINAIQVARNICVAGQERRCQTDYYGRTSIGCGRNLLPLFGEELSNCSAAIRLHAGTEGQLIPFLEGNKLSKT